MLSWLMGATRMSCRMRMAKGKADMSTKKATWAAEGPTLSRVQCCMTRMPKSMRPFQSGATCRRFSCDMTRLPAGRALPSHHDSARETSGTAAPRAGR